MDYSSTGIVEHTIFYLFNEIQMIKSIKKETYKKNCVQRQTSRISV